MRRLLLLPLAGLLAVVVAAPGICLAQSDCLACHGDATMQNSAGQSIAVNGTIFHASVHGSFKCSDCHADIKSYPHPAHIAPVSCKKCHADVASTLADSVHRDGATNPCTSCHGNAHAIFPKSDPRSNVYPLNIPRTCGSCHGKDGIAQKHGLPNVIPAYVDSIHGLALSNEGLLVAANCQSCHGSHHILSRTNPKSSTYKTNVPSTCGACHAKIYMEYENGDHGKAIKAGNLKAPVCSDCHTAHAIMRPTDAKFRMQSTPQCGSCHKDKLSTYHDTFHSQLGLLGGYVETARCSDCHGAHEVLPASNPRSPIAPQNLVHTCSKCHADANTSFVKYQPHANSHDWKTNPQLYFIRLFMSLLLIGVLTFFAIHTALWVVRSHYENLRSKKNNGDKNV